MARDPLKLFVKVAWTALNVRCANGKYHLDSRRNAAYRNVELRVTRDELSRWCEQQRDHIRALRRPSIDRLDSGTHYTLDNMQIIELAENIRKDKTIFRDGYGVCSRCKDRKPEDLFARDRRRSNGRATICQKCERARGSERSARRSRESRLSGVFRIRRDFSAADAVGIGYAHSFAGITYPELAAAYSASQSSIRRVCVRKTKRVS